MRRRRVRVLALLVAVAIVVLLLLRGCDHREQCMINLSEVGEKWLLMTDDARREAMRHRGSAMLLAWRKAGLLDEKLLRCPDDPDLSPPDAAAHRAYDEADLSNPPDDLCSYAVRDFERFPLADDVSDRKEVIACCRCGRDGRTPHHRGDVMVLLFGEGDVQAMTPEELGFGPDDPVVVGPESKSDLLRVLIQR